MESRRPPDRMEALLEHRGWVRGVARALVRDDSTADDLEQETWLRAMDGEPPRSPKAWLGTVLRNLASNLRRGEGRRGAREGARPTPAAPPTPDELLERAEVVERVARAVRTLDEPYRTVVLLRYFEDLPPPEIAGRLGVPLETVRTRLRRALALLRERLDEGEERGRRRWAVVLLPLARTPDPVAPGGPAGGWSPAAAAGVLAMATNMKVAVGTAAALLLAAVAWRTLAPAGEGNLPAPAPDPGAVAVAPRPGTGGGEPAPAAPAAADGVAGVDDGPPGTETLRVLVRDAGGGPVAGARVSLHERPAASYPEDGAIFGATSPAQPPAPVATVVTDATGTCSLTGLRTGDRVLGVAAEGRARRWMAVVLRPGEPRETLVVDLDAACSVSGRVLAADGAPLAGVTVVAAGPSAWRTNSLGRATTTSDGKGRYALSDLEPGHTMLAVWQEPGRRQDVAWVSLPAVAEIDLRLPPLARVRGRVLDDGTGQPVAGAVVVAWLLPEEGARIAFARIETDGEGRFLLEGIPAGRLGNLNVRAAGYLPYPDGRGYSVERKVIRVSEGTTVEQEVRLLRGATLSGRVTDAAGAPVEGALVQAWQTAGQPGQGRADAKGRYRIDGLPPGAAVVLPHADGMYLPGSPARPVEALAAGEAPVSQVAMLVAGEEAVLDLVLAPGVSVEGRVVDGDGRPVEGAGVWVWPGGGVPVPSATDGSFRAVAAPGAGRVVEATAPGGRRGRSDKIVVPATGSLRDVEVILEAGGAVAGRVRRADGGSLRGARLRVVPRAPEPSNPWAWGGHVAAAPAATVGDDGSFAAEGLAPGPCTLAAWDGDCPEVVVTLGLLAPGEHREGIEVVLAPGAALAGRVQDGAGRAVAGAQVSVQTEESARRGIGVSVIAAVTDGSGAFRVERLPRDPHAVHVRAPGFRPASTGGMPGGEPVTVVLETADAIGGILVDEDTGAPLPGVGVMAVPAASPQDWSNSQAVSGADGRFLIAGLAAGMHRIRAGVNWPAHDYLQREVGPVAAGTRDLRIPLRRGLAIDGRVEGPDGGVPPGVGVQITTLRSALVDGGARTWRSTQARADGTFHVGGLDAADYDITVTDQASDEAAAFPRTIVTGVRAGTGDLAIRIPASLRIAGRVRLEGGGAPGVVEYQYLNSGGGVVTILKTKEDGTFRTGLVPEGAAQDLHFHPGGTLLNVSLRGVLPGRTDLDVVFREGGTIAGRVVDPDGNPVAAGVPVAGGGRGVTEEGGVFVLRGVGDRSYTVSAGGPPSAWAPTPAEGKFTAGATGIVIRVLPCAPLSGRVVRADGTPVAGLDVSVDTVDEGTGPGAFDWIATDAEGRFTARGFPPGTVRFKGLHPSRGDVDLGTAVAPATDLVLTLPE